MKADYFYFMIQSLEHDDQDQVVAISSTMECNDENERFSEYVETILESFRSAVPYKEDDSISWKWNGLNFLLRISTEDFDQSGRPAPIMCMGRLTGQLNENLAIEIVKRLRAFCRFANRTFPNDFETGISELVCEMIEKERELSSYDATLFSENKKELDSR